MKITEILDFIGSIKLSDVNKMKCRSAVEPGGIFRRLSKRRMEGLWNEVLLSDMHDQHAVDHLDALLRREDGHGAHGGAV